MKAREITLDENELPHRVLVSMSMREVLFIARLVGRLNDPQMDELISNGSAEGHEIWDCLSKLWNRFSDGVPDALRGEQS